MDDLHRIAGVPEGTLVVGLGIPMSEVARRSSMELHKLYSGASGGSYDHGNAYFDFELLGSKVRFHGCSMYSINFEGPAETVTSVAIDITPSRHRWSALQRELRETEAKLKTDGWEPYAYPGWEPLDAFLARDGSKVGSSDSGAIATFEWRKTPWSFRLTAHRNWDEGLFWSTAFIARADFWDPPIVLATPTPTPAERPKWLSEFPAYESASLVCSGHVTGRAEDTRKEVTFSMYASEHHPASVVLFYAAERDVEVKDDASSLNVATPDGRKQVSIYPLRASYPDCGTKPPAGTQTVFIVSESR